MGLNPNTLSYPILIIDDDPDVLDVMTKFLQRRGYTNIDSIQDSRLVMSYLKLNDVAVILLDLLMPHVKGSELLPQILKEYPRVPVIMFSGSQDLLGAVDCIKAGALDYLTKPVNQSKVVMSVDKALHMHTFKASHPLKDHLTNPLAFREIVTCSRIMWQTFMYAEQVAETSNIVLITGETGVGKELMAKAIHKASGVSGAFVDVNVAGLDDYLFSDTLFGHVKGAYTGADQVREGLIGKAVKGTLFLDEIGDLNPASQIKLLRLLQEGVYYPQGSDSPRVLDARIILATNHDLTSKVSNNEFRQDLYYRIIAHHIKIPSLRERPDDLPLLLDHFVSEAAAMAGKQKLACSDELLLALPSFSLPGNVREFKALVQDAVVRHRTGPLTLSHFPSLNLQPPGPSLSGTNADSITSVFGRIPTLVELESYLVDAAIQITNGNKSMAAKLLGLTRQGLHHRLRFKPSLGNDQKC